MTRQKLAKALKRDAQELERMYELKYGKPYLGHAPGYWGFDACWGYANPLYKENCWYTRFFYTLIHQRLWAMHYIFGVVTSEELLFYKVKVLNAERLLWYERSPKSFIERGLLLNP